MQPAVGFVGDGHFNKLATKSRPQICLSERLAITQTQASLEFLPFHFPFHSSKQLFDLGDDLWGDLGDDLGLLLVRPGSWFRFWFGRGFKKFGVWGL